MGAIGYLGVLISVLGFGSNFIPLKKLKIGDGVFFQFCMCNAIFMTSIPVLIIQKFPEIHGLALFGGFLWCTGNMLCPIAIRLIGMGLGLLVWGSVSMVMGWASGTYGLFGLNKQDVKNPILNVFGVVLAMVGLLVFLQVKTNAKNQENEDIGKEKLLNNLATEDEENVNVDFRVMKSKDLEDLEEEEDFFDSMDENTKRIVGLICAAIAGIFFGTSFDPSQWVIDNKYDGDDNSMNYVFTHYTGILLSSWGYLMMYLVYKYWNKKQPYIPGECILPATISGVLWGIAEIAWFFANGQLGFTVTFPIISCGPGFVGAFWGIFLFNEISGIRNFTLLGLAILITVPALVMVAMSH